MNHTPRIATPKRELNRSRSSPLSRREFLKLAVLGAGALALRPFAGLTLPDFPQADKLGRVTVGKVDVFARPGQHDDVAFPPEGVD